MIEIKGKPKGKVTVVMDAQAGSCGKGKFIGYIAGTSDIDYAICNFMSNAGHTYVADDGHKIMTQQLPTSIVNPNTNICIGPEAAITPNILFDEILKYKELIDDRKVYIHPNALVIADKHRQLEQNLLRSGSTFKGCGAARADKVLRQAMLFKEFWYTLNGGLFDESYDDLNYCCEKHDFDLLYNVIKVVDTAGIINDCLDNGGHVIVEGSQGFDLDINFGLGYPYTTSRQCHAGQLVADCGISPRLVDDVIMIMRPYPIRISNVTNLKDNNGDTLVTSSGDYAGSEEITWGQVRERCGAPRDMVLMEQTTVTKKTRRVFEMNWDRLKYAVKINRPTQIALNFVQYIDWGAYHCTRYEDLPYKVKEFMAKVERETDVPVTLVGTGERNCDIIDIR